MSFLLTTDDLRAMRRLVGVWLPQLALDRDAAALRGPLDLDEVTSFAEAFTDAAVAAEAVVDRAAVVTEYAYSRGSTGAQGLMEALPRGLVQCTCVAANPLASLTGLAGLVPADGPEWTVDSDLFNQCDDLALGGDEEGAVAVLQAGGVAALTAKAWVTAVCGRRSAAAVTVVRRCADRLEAAELRWLADEAGGAWRIGVRDKVHVLTPVSGDQLRTALDVLCEGEQA